jgi:hypothetical protein
VGNGAGAGTSLCHACPEASWSFLSCCVADAGAKKATAVREGLLVLCCCNWSDAAGLFC